MIKTILYCIPICMHNGHNPSDHVDARPSLLALRLKADPRGFYLGEAVFGLK